MDSPTKAQIQKHLQSLKSAVLYLELCLQDGADHKQLNLASKGIVLSAAFMDERIRKLTEQGSLPPPDRSKAHPTQEGSEFN